MDTMTRMQVFIAVADAGGFLAVARETGGLAGSVRRL